MGKQYSPDKVLTESFVDLPWGEMSQVSLTTVPTDIPLGVLTVTGLPAGATIIRIEIFIKFSERDNTNAAVNSVSGPQNIQVQKNAGAFISCLAFAGGEYSTPASTTGAAGDVLMPTADVSSLAPVNGDTLTVQWTNATAAQNDLVFDNVQVGARIFYMM